MAACNDTWAMLNFHDHVRDMAMRDKTKTGKCTTQILDYIVCAQGIDDMLRNFEHMQLLRNKHGVATDMPSVNAYMLEARMTGDCGNKSDMCDVAWHFNEWLHKARQSKDNLIQLQKLARIHGRNVYLEFRVMGGGEEQPKDASLCGQWCVDVLLRYLCEDVGLCSNILLISSDSFSYEEAAAAAGVTFSTMT